MELSARKLWASLKFPPYAWCACLVAVGGFIFGYDTGSIGSITLMPQFDATFGPLNATLQGLVVSSILIPAALISLVSGNIADRISRTHAISLGAFVYGAGAFVDCFAGFTAGRASRLAMLFAGRVVCGLGEGLFLSTITVYSVEISPRHVRGKVGAIVQLFIVTGILAGYFVCYGTLALASSLAWRVPFGMQGVVCALLCATALCLPHSPRWLLHVGRRADAERTLEWLGLAAEEKEELLAYDEEMQRREAGRDRARGWRKAVQDLQAVWTEENRGRTVLALYMMGAQQLAGIDGVLYYAPRLFEQAGLSSSGASFLASGATGIVNVVFTVIAQIFTDRLGRRPTLIWGGVGMGTAMTLIGLLYATGAGGQRAGQLAVIVLIFAYFVAFVVSWAIMVRIHVSEAQPTATRALVASLGQSANWLVNWIVAFTTPLFLDRYPSGPYFLWAASIWLSVALFVCFLPETRGRVLENSQLVAVVDSPLRRFWKTHRARRRRGEAPETPAPEPDVEDAPDALEVLVREKTQKSIQRISTREV